MTKAVQNYIVIMEILLSLRQPSSGVCTGGYWRSRTHKMMVHRPPMGLLSGIVGHKVIKILSFLSGLLAFFLPFILRRLMKLSVIG